MMRLNFFLLVSYANKRQNDYFFRQKKKINAFRCAIYIKCRFYICYLLREQKKVRIRTFSVKVNFLPTPVF